MLNFHTFASWIIYKKIHVANFNKIQVYMLLCRGHTLSLNCPFCSKYLVDVHLYHSHLFIVDIYVHGMAIRGGITAHNDFDTFATWDNIQKISYGKF